MTDETYSLKHKLNGLGPFKDCGCVDCTSALRCKPPTYRTWDYAGRIITSTLNWLIVDA